MHTLRANTLRPAFSILASAIAALSMLAPARANAASPASVATQDYLVHTWQTDDGLPQNWVSSIAQTPEGYLWIGTRYGGLARFDGMRFVLLNQQNTRALQDVQIRNLSVDAEGRLWIVMGNRSVTSFHNNTFQIHRTPRQPPRIRLDHVLSTHDDEILFAGETPLVAKASITPDKTTWTFFDPRPEIDIIPRTLCIDRNEVVWAVTRDHKIVRRQTTAFEPLPDSLAPTLPPGAAFTYVDADKTGAVWAATANRILRWEDGHGFVDATPANGPAPVSIAQIEFSGDNGLWVLEKKRLRKCLDGRWVAEIDTEQLLQNVGTGANGATLHGDMQGNVWLSSYGRGLWLMKSDGTAKFFNEQSGLPSLFITCWYQDTEGNVWIGSTGGLTRIRESIFTTLGSTQGLPDKVVSSVCIDRQGKLWAGTMTGSLVSWENGAFKKHPLSIPSERNPVAGLTVSPTRDGSIWIGSVNYGLMRLREGETHIRGNWRGVRVLFEDSQKNLWVGSLIGLSLVRSKRITPFDTKSSEAPRAPGGIAEDRAGAIWIGTNTNPGELWKYDKGAFTKYLPPLEWPAARISAVLADAEGTIWVGTLGSGLLRFRDGQFTRITTQNGLPDNNIAQLLDSGDGHIWAGTYAGIFRAHKTELATAAEGKTATASLRIYGRFDGLPSLECTSEFQPACWRADNGTLYFSTANGIVAVNPSQVTENKTPPTVIIEELIVDGKRLEIPPAAHRGTAKNKHPSAIEIAPGQHHVQFQFTALNFTAPDGVRFRVKLDGADTEWRNVDSRRLIGYGPLLPGKYRFHVNACNNDGVWNETGDMISFEVLAHFWETAWFKITLTLALLAALVITATRMQRLRYRRRLQHIERQHELERERTRIAQDLHDDLGASLTQINLLSALANRNQTLPGETRDIIQQMNGYARKMVTALDEIVWAVNPKNDSWYELANYLGFFAEEFFRNTSIRCRLDISEQIPPRPVLSEVRHHVFLAVKEALNNAAQHSEASHVWLRINIHETTALIQIEDDGCGIKHKPGATRSSGNGLVNMRRRMEQTGGTVGISEGADGHGTVVTFRIPLVKLREN